MKRQCRKAEWMWRKTKLEIHYNIYKDSLHAFNVELATARQNFFSNLINSNLNNTHTLFATAEWLTTPQVRFPVKCSPRANVMSLLPSFLRRSIISERRLAHSLSYAEVTQIRPQFQKEVTAVTKSYYHLKNIAIIISFVCSQDLKKLVHAFITSSVDYCNGLLTGLPKKANRQLQLIQNAAARILTRTRKS